jgi:predicted AAA+ superfamily ATPase
MQNTIYPRQITPKVIAALRDSPVVLINGARQVGKSTLAQMLLKNGYKATYLTLDEATTLSALHADPRAFLEAIDGNLIIDEVQRVPEVFRTIKAMVDEKRTPGRFLLTGSANVLLLPKLSESLAGRMEILTLYPLSQSEIEKSPSSFLEHLFRSRFPAGAAVSPESLEALNGRLVRGGYPEAVLRPDKSRRQKWFDAYLTTILQRDIREIANIEGMQLLPRLLASLSSRSGSLLNYAAIAAESGIPQSTLRRYISLFEASYLVGEAPPWSVNIGKRLVKTPKIYVLDTGLALGVLGADQDRLGVDGELRGRMLETFVYAELLKHSSWSNDETRLFHFRSHAGDEVDFVVERADGRIVGIEVKSQRSIGTESFKGLRLLQQQQKNRFHRGVVLYGGKQTISFGRDLFAVPIQALWMVQR